MARRRLRHEFAPDVFLLADDDGVIALDRKRRCACLVRRRPLRPPGGARQGAGRGAASALRRSTSRQQGDEMLELRGARVERRREAALRPARVPHRRAHARRSDRQRSSAARRTARRSAPSTSRTTTPTRCAATPRRCCAASRRSRPATTAGRVRSRRPTRRELRKRSRRELSYTTRRFRSRWSLEAGAVVRYVLFDRGFDGRRAPAPCPSTSASCRPATSTRSVPNPTVVARLTNADPAARPRRCA